MKKFDPVRAAVLDDAERLRYVDPARIVELLDVPTGGTVVDFGTGVYAIEIAERALVLDWNPAVERPRGPSAEHLYTDAQARELFARFGLHASPHDGFPYHLAYVCRRAAAFF